MMKACSNGIGFSVTLEDVEFLKLQYKESRIVQFEAQSDVKELIGRGMARGLEIALIRLGVSNDECDSLTHEAWQETRECRED